MRSLRLSFLAIASLAALAACDAGEGDEAEASAPADSSSATGSSSASTSEAFALAETGWLTVGADGAVLTTFFDPNGRYRDLRNGSVLAEGHWERRADETLCFEPDQGLGACWTTSPIDESGKALATDSDGKSIEITRVTYRAPAPVEETVEPEDAPADEPQE